MEKTSPVASEGVPYSNEELFWMAYDTSLDAWQIASLGGVIDERRQSILGPLDARNELTPDSLLEWQALWTASQHLDYRYGHLTGFQRTGCSMGAPAPYN